MPPCGRLDGQIAKLRAEGCSVIRSEKVSGVSRDGRTELATILDFLRQGDELVVTRLDRLSRDTRDVLNLIHECEARGASVTVLDAHVSTKGELGHVVLTVLGMVAQMERRFIKERHREGISRAKAEGAYRGGKVWLDHDRTRSLLADGLSGAIEGIATFFRLNRSLQVRFDLRARALGRRFATTISQSTPHGPVRRTVETRSVGVLAGDRRDPGRGRGVVRVLAISCTVGGSRYSPPGDTRAGRGSADGGRAHLPAQPRIGAGLQLGSDPIPRRRNAG